MLSSPLDPRKFYFHATPLSHPPSGEGWLLVDVVAEVSGSIATVPVETNGMGRYAGGTHGGLGSSIVGIWAAPIETVVWVCPECGNELALMAEPTSINPATEGWADDPRGVLLACRGGTPECARKEAHSDSWAHSWPKMIIRTTARISRGSL
jgi:hypothetical protein